MSGPFLARRRNCHNGSIPVTTSKDACGNRLPSLPRNLACWTVCLALYCSIPILVADASPLVEKGEHDTAEGPYRVLRITPSDEEQLALLSALSRNSKAYDLDFWHSPLRVNASIDVMVGPTKFGDFQDLLRQRGLTSRLTIADVQKRYIRWNEKINAAHCALDSSECALRGFCLRSDKTLPCDSGELLANDYIKKRGRNFFTLVTHLGCSTKTLIESKQTPRRKGKPSLGASGTFSRRLKDDSGSPFSTSRYHSYAEIQQYMADLERRYPNLARVFTIGQTHEGRPIQLLKVLSAPLLTENVGSPASESTSKRGFWIDGGIHAREWVAPTTALYFIDQLVNNYETDQVIRQYMDQMDWYILPVVNPDGYEYSRSSSHPKTRLWRKNRSPNACKFSNNAHCCQGVDLNRNFEFHWGEVGASDDPCEEIYAGSSAFSEPETRAIRDFILYRPGRFDGFVTLHSYSQIWMYPWGHQRGSYPVDVKDLQNVAIQAKRALQANYGTKYIVGTGADTLYPASGGSDDWAKERASIKYVYLIELRPEEHIYDGFILDESLIVPTAKETWDGIKIVADAILQMNGIKPLNASPRKSTDENS